MAEAVSWQAGAMRRGVGEGGQFGERAGELADVGAGRDELGRAGEVEVEAVEDLAAPLLLVELDELGVGGVGVLGDARAAPVGEQILGQVEPLLAFGQAGELVGVELVDGVERQDLDAGELAHALLAALAMGGALGLDGAGIAIAEGIGERIAGGVDADVVDGPAIDGDGANAFGGDFGALAHALFDAADDAVEVPAQAAVDLAGVVGEAMDQLDGRACRSSSAAARRGSSPRRDRRRSRLVCRWASAVVPANSSSRSSASSQECLGQVRRRRG